MGRVWWFPTNNQWVGEGHNIPGSDEDSLRCPWAREWSIWNAITSHIFSMSSELFLILACLTCTGQVSDSHPRCVCSAWWYLHEVQPDWTKWGGQGSSKSPEEAQLGKTSRCGSLLGKGQGKPMLSTKLFMFVFWTPNVIPQLKI
jgi:hypothetical protein